MKPMACLKTLLKNTKPGPLIKYVDLTAMNRTCDDNNCVGMEFLYTTLNNFFFNKNKYFDVEEIEFLDRLEIYWDLAQKRGLGKYEPHIHENEIILLCANLKINDDEYFNSVVERHLFDCFKDSKIIWNNNFEECVYKDSCITEQFHRPAEFHDQFEMTTCKAEEFYHEKVIVGKIVRVVKHDIKDELIPTKACSWCLDAPKCICVEPEQIVQPVFDKEHEDKLVQDFKEVKRASAHKKVKIERKENKFRKPKQLRPTVCLNTIPPLMKKKYIRCGIVNSSTVNFDYSWFVRPNNFKINSQEKWTKWVEKYNITLNDLLQIHDLNVKRIGRLPGDVRLQFYHFIPKLRSGKDFNSLYEECMSDHLKDNGHHPKDTPMNIKDTIEMLCDLWSCAMRYTSDWYEAYQMFSDWIRDVDRGITSVKEKFQQMHPAGLAMFYSGVQANGISNKQYHIAKIVRDKFKLPLSQRAIKYDWTKEATIKSYRVVSKMPEYETYIYDTKIHVSIVNTLTPFWGFVSEHDKDKSTWESLISYTYNWVIKPKLVQETAFECPNCENTFEHDVGKCQDQLSFTRRLMDNINLVKQKGYQFADDITPECIKNLVNTMTNQLSELSVFVKGLIGKIQDIFKPIMSFLGLDNLDTAKVTLLSLEIVKYYILYINTDSSVIHCLCIFSILHTLGIVDKVISSISEFFSDEEEEPIPSTSKQQPTFDFNIIGRLKDVFEKLTSIDPKTIAIPLGFIALLFFGIKLTTSQLTSLGSSFVANMRNMHFIGGGIIGITRFFETLMKAVRFVLDWIGKNFFNIVPEDEKLKEEMEKLTKTYSSWATELMKLTTDSTVQTIGNTKPFINRSKALIKKGEEFYKMRLENKLPREIAMTFSKNWDKVCELHNIVSRIESTAQFRVTPFHLQIAGEIGIGKSTLLKKLTTDITEKFFPEVVNATYAQGNTEQMDGYIGQPIFLIDDMFPANDYKLMLPLLTIISNAPLMLYTSHLWSKGTQFTSKFILSTTNTPYPNIDTVYETKAFLRRRHILVKVTGDDRIKKQGKFDEELFKKYYPNQSSHNFPHLKFTLKSVMEDKNLDLENYQDGITPPTTDIDYEHFKNLLFSRYCAQTNEEVVFMNDENESINRLTQQLSEFDDCYNQLRVKYNLYTKIYDENFKTNISAVPGKFVGVEVLLDDISNNELSFDERQTRWLKEILPKFKEFKYAMFEDCLRTYNQFFSVNNIICICLKHSNLRRFAQKISEFFSIDCYYQNLKQDGEQFELIEKQFDIVRNQIASLKMCVNMKIDTLTTHTSRPMSLSDMAKRIIPLIPNDDYNYHLIMLKAFSYYGNFEIQNCFPTWDEYKKIPTFLTELVEATAYYVDPNWTRDDIFLHITEQRNAICKLLKSFETQINNIKNAHTIINLGHILLGVNNNSDFKVKIKQLDDFVAVTKTKDKCIGHFRGMFSQIDELKENLIVLETALECRRIFVDYNLEPLQYGVLTPDLGYKIMPDMKYKLAVQFTYPPVRVNVELERCQKEQIDELFKNQFLHITKESWDLMFGLEDGRSTFTNGRTNLTFEFLDLLKTFQTADNEDWYLNFNKVQDKIFNKICVGNGFFVTSNYNNLYTNSAVYQDCVSYFFSLTREQRNQFYMIYHKNYDIIHRYIAFKQDLKYTITSYFNKLWQTLTGGVKYLWTKLKEYKKSIGIFVLSVSIIGACTAFSTLFLPQHTAYSQSSFFAKSSKGVAGHTSQSTPAKKAIDGVIRVSIDGMVFQAYKIYNHCLMVPWHAVSHVKKQPKRSFYLSLTIAPGVIHTYNLDSTQVYYFENSDLALIFNPRFQPWGDRICYLKTAAEIDCEKGSVAFTAVRTKDGDVVMEEAPYEGVKSKVSTMFSNSVSINHNYVGVIEGYAMRGVSGSPIFTTTVNSNMTTIAGFQSYRESDKSYFSIVPRENVSQLVNTLVENVVKFEGPLYVTDLVEETNLYDPHVTIIGGVPKEYVVPLVANTEFTKTDISFNFETHRVPAVLSKSSKYFDPSGIHPAYNSLNKFGRDSFIEIPEKRLQLAVDEIYQYYKHRIDKLKILTMEEAILGNSSMSHIDLNSSPGLPWIFDRKGFDGKKKWININDKGELTFIHEELKTSVDYLIDNLKKKNIPKFTCLEIMKDELRPAHKAYGLTAEEYAQCRHLPPGLWKSPRFCKTRTIIVMPQEDNIIYRMFSGDLYNKFHDLSINGTEPFAIGINCESLASFNAYSFAKTLNEVGIDLDVSNWDGHCTVQLFDYVTQLENKFYNDTIKNQNLRESYTRRNVWAYVQFLKFVIQKSQGQCSGSPETSNKSTFGHILLGYVQYVDCMLSNNLPDYVPYRVYRRMVLDVYYNDDRFIVVHSSISSFYNPNFIINWYSHYGWPCTNSAKTGTFGCVPLNELVFLKRTWILDPEYPFYVHWAMDKQTIEDLCFYQRRSFTPRLQFEVNLLTALDFAADHGEEYFNYLLNKINTALKIKKLKPVNCTYTSVRYIKLDRYFGKALPSDYVEDLDVFRKLVLSNSELYNQIE